MSQRPTPEYPEEAVLVAGYDYRRQGIPFRELCLSRMNFLQSRSSNRIVRFTLFDIGRGLVQTRSQSAPEWNTVQTYRPVTAANYSGDVFCRDQQGIMSITDVYSYLRSVGSARPGSIQEMSIFSHGYVLGPILVNSFDQTADNVRSRDPYDKDGRAHKDFVPPTMDDQFIAALGAAFHPSGYVWLWGCAFDHGYRDVLYQVLRTPRYRQTSPCKVVDTEIFHFSFSPAQASSYFNEDEEFFPTAPPHGRASSFDRSFRSIKTYFQRGLADTYAAKMSQAMKVSARAALPGTYADIESGKVNVPYPLMVIPTRKPPFDDDFTRYITFYTRCLGVAQDPEQRGYGVYEHVQ
jgi:hypothetical protein